MNLPSTVLFLLFASIALGEDYFITGGIEEDTHGAFPYLVSIRLRNVHFCGGSILNERYILTAAHCVHKKSVELMSIQYGKAYINSNGPYIIKVKSYIMHGDYSNNTFYNDIAVLKLKDNIVYGDAAVPVVLPKYNEIMPWDTEEMYLMGWRNVANDKTNIVQYTKISSLFNNMYCSRQEPLFDSTFQFCGAILGGIYNNNLCHVDSGGPLIIKGRQFGIFSWSINPCSAGDHNTVIFTKIIAYRIWITFVTGI